MWRYLLEIIKQLVLTSHEIERLHSSVKELREDFKRLSEEIWANRDTARRAEENRERLGAEIKESHQSNKILDEKIRSLDNFLQRMADEVKHRSEIAKQERNNLELRLRNELLIARHNLPPVIAMPLLPPATDDQDTLG